MQTASVGSARLNAEEVEAIRPNRPRAIEVNRPYLGSFDPSIHGNRSPWLQRQQRQHPARLSLFRAIRIVMFQIAGRTDTAVVNFFDTGIATLPGNFGGEINFVMRRPNAGAELRDQIARPDTKSLAHPFNCAPNDSEGSSFLARMNQTNCCCILVNQIDRAAVGHINPEANIPLIRNQPITPFETLF